MIITIASLKGGVGKTTTAVHLSAYLQHQADTLLIDAAPNHSATGWGKRGKFPFDVVDEWSSPGDRRHYAHVVIDTQLRPKPDELLALAESCDLLLLPTTLDVLALDALVILLENLKALSITHYQLLLTLVPSKPSRDAEQIKTILTNAQLPLCTTSIRQLSVFQKAAQTGVLVYDLKEPKALEAWDSYQQVGQELLLRSQP